MALEKLFSPFSIGSLTLENRIVMPPMATNYATAEGFVSDRMIAYYVERAKGGVGYINVEHTAVHQQGKASPKMLMISSDEHAAQLKRLVDAVHAAGGKIVIQINHAGRQTFSAVTGAPIVGPSPVAALPTMETPHALSAGEIEALVGTYTAAAQRVKQIGADGVELHMAHGYLLCSFLSPFSNQRTDAYGGDLAGRARFPLAVLKSVRHRVGPDFPIICRLSGDEYVDQGLKITETTRIARLLEEESADAVHISACNAASGYLNHPPYYVEEGVFVHLAQAIKAEVDIPVITVGRIRTPQLADRVIREGKADLVSMGRALLADAHLPNKAKEGRFDEIVPCVSCNKCIQTLRQDSVRCTVNPETGNEAQFKFAKAEQPKKVWIVGGGPAGLKTAEIAALRGHRVTIFEREKILGGRMRLGAVPPQKAVYIDFLDYLENRINALGVSVEIGKKFTVEMLESGRPQAVVVATGALPQLPQWEGIQESNAVTTDDVLSGREETGDNVLIIGGGGTGAEIADYLSDMGKRVTIVEMLDGIATDLVNHLQHYLLKRLNQKNVTMITSTKVKSLGRGFAMVEDASGFKKLDGFDSIVLALGSASDDRVFKEMKGKLAELHVIGDAVQPREIVDAVYEAEEIAIRL
jgi:2,4-dienoyl-CoA reductase-like NADH-dependent reductase (Old Yellow Enzyme family)/thioredoxin reductase